jgi:hypothetical protein
MEHSLDEFKHRTFGEFRGFSWRATWRPTETPGVYVGAFLLMNAGTRDVVLEREAPLNDATEGLALQRAALLAQEVAGQLRVAIDQGDEAVRALRILWDSEHLARPA